jgi:hypothetical protein
MATKNAQESGFVYLQWFRNKISPQKVAQSTWGGQLKVLISDSWAKLSAKYHQSRNQRRMVSIDTSNEGDRQAKQQCPEISDGGKCIKVNLIHITGS